MFSVLLSSCTGKVFGGSLASNSKRPIKHVSFNNQPCQARPTFVDLLMKLFLSIY